ncbi:hypothetical protein H5410_014861 [Solanum commersonii]|uniref:Uncharacterized protein n=1 Tax=Solanum commersonii TaxID=4109 RepID=A0A9J5ZS11_SOLCO|nr:hypothetical protein H5410_014861 [Solanum commersonii]
MMEISLGINLESEPNIYTFYVTTFNEGYKVRKGHYNAKMNEKIEKVEEKKGWSSQNPLGDSSSGPPTLLKFQRNSPWTKPTWRANGKIGDMPKGSTIVIKLAKSFRII